MGWSAPRESATRGDCAATDTVRLVSMRNIGLIVASAAAVISAGCDNKPTGIACTPELFRALDISVVDSVSGSVVPSATIVVTDATPWYDSADVVRPQHFYAGTSPGTYTITARSAGYLPWTLEVAVPIASNVNGCTAPATRTVRARLQKEL